MIRRSCRIGGLVGEPDDVAIDGVSHRFACQCEEGCQPIAHITSPLDRGPDHGRTGFVAKAGGHDDDISRPSQPKRHPQDRTRITAWLNRHNQTAGSEARQQPGELTAMGADIDGEPVEWHMADQDGTPMAMILPGQGLPGVHQQSGARLEAIVIVV
ncbi:MAG: hypothetical protein QOF70_5158 [Acetobacteraceae bacterium]|nr:hypothetical protein [Acetobacteraceae bacterium]